MEDAQTNRYGGKGRYLILLPQWHQLDKSNLKLQQNINITINIDIDIWYDVTNDVDTYRNPSTSEFSEMSMIVDNGLENW